MRRLTLLCLVLLLVAAVMRAQEAVPGAKERLDRQFQAAVAQYESGRLPEAAAALEVLIREVPESFEVHELLGLVYSAQSQDAKASPHLEKAVRLKPDSASARMNLAINLVQLGKLQPAEAEFKKALELEPQNYDANHNLGELFVRAGRVPAGMPYLEQAQRINPAAYDNGYDLALAYIVTNRLPDARQLLQNLLKQKDSAELHNLLAEVEEKDGKFVDAANQYELAAHLDPSEGNLFDWGSELLLHRTLDPAITIFEKAAERYPNSPRMAIGLGIAYYSRGNYDNAVKSLLHAADLTPADPRVYPFLLRAYDSSPSQAEDVLARFRRFAEQQPNNGRAQYYYAMSLWKGKRAQDSSLDLAQIGVLLKKAIALDPSLAEAHLQLGNLNSDQQKYADAIPEYRRALELNSDLADAHYRLGQAYVHTGEKDKAQEHLQVYQKLREQHLADLDKQRAEVRQFVYAAKDPQPARK
jgi:tetratricopeptide (TPR) repeat protein